MTCDNLTNMTIGKNIETIGNQALMIGSSSKKVTIIFKSITPPSIGTNLIQKSYLNRILVPTGCANAYKTATNWTAFADYIYEIETGA